MNPSWTPILSGDKYCSTACGCGCTKAAYDSALSGALKLATELGEGWQPKVWENGNWYYRAEHSLMGKDTMVEVCPASYGGYRCYFNGVKQFIADGDTPAEALMGAVVEAQAFVDALQFQIIEAQK